MISEARAPIALFVYKRSEHARRTIQSLQACRGYDESPLYVFADGPKAASDAAAVAATRTLARTLLGDRATYVERDENLGLANSIISGTDRLCKEHGRVIVVEDDLLLAPSFLEFLNEGLMRYRDEPRVMQISGHIVDAAVLRGVEAGIFLPLTTSWGWATWDRAWDHFDQAASGWREMIADHERRRLFDLNGNYAYSKMLQRQMAGQIDSWAIRWYFSVFKQHGLSLFPPQTLVQNAGLDGSGTHRSVASKLSSATWAGKRILMPERVAPTEFADEVFKSIRKNSRAPIMKYLKTRFLH